jgi:hypothetical protein
MSEVPECFGCFGLTDDCFECPFADECEAETIEQIRFSFWRKRKLKVEKP